MQLIRTKGNVNKSTISREISRNSDGRNKSYKPDLAHRKVHETNKRTYSLS